MTLPSLITKEISHRRGNFALGALSVAVAVACLCGTVLALRAYDHETERQTDGMEAATQAEMAKLEDEIRKSMKGLGFNIFIYPEGQDLGEVYSQGYASKTMPESYVEKLASTDIVTVNHLLPQLTRKLKWPERERTILLIGVRGEVPIAHRDPKSPLIQPVEPGKVVLGYELHKSGDLKPGGKVTLLGESFEIAKCHDERGTVDDITIWISLSEAQRLLEEEGKINAILALECNCATVDRLGEIRAEIAGILPGTQVVETESKALARAEARNLAKATAQKRIATMQSDRTKLRESRARLFSWLAPLAALGSMVWIAYLAFTNVRQRLTEIGTLRAIGVQASTILGAFLGRAALTGSVGVALAILVVVAAQALGVFPDVSLSTTEWTAVAMGAPMMACIAAWLPALSAASTDPAAILRHD